MEGNDIVVWERHLEGPDEGLLEYRGELLALTIEFRVDFLKSNVRVAHCHQCSESRTTSAPARGST